jgi:ABC-type uncharacterized transport system permease subunit
MIDFLVSVLSLTIPAGTALLLGTLGEVYAERSGVLNLGVEGMMIMGAITAFGITFVTKNLLLGILAACVAGALMSLIHAYVSVTLRVNQVVSGLALTMVGLGISGLIGKQFIGMPLPVRMTPISIPVLSDLPILGPVLFRYNLLVYISIGLVPVLAYILYKTNWGIVLRSVGENPAAADAMGVNVFLVRYLAVMFGGVMAGLAGAFLSVAYAPAWIEGMTAGAGWIVIALTIFSLYDPVRAMFGAYLFGGVRVLQFRLQPLGIPANFLNMLPFLITIFVLVLISEQAFRRRIGVPAALMQPYSREDK